MRNTPTRGEAAAKRPLATASRPDGVRGAGLESAGIDQRLRPFRLVHAGNRDAAFNPLVHLDLAQHQHRTTADAEVRIDRDSVRVEQPVHLHESPLVGRIHARRIDDHRRVRGCRRAACGIAPQRPPRGDAGDHGCHEQRDGKDARRTRRHGSRLSRPPGSTPTTRRCRFRERQAQSRRPCADARSRPR